MDEQEFAMILKRAALKIPAERHAAMLEAVTRFEELLTVLDDPLAYEDEPATLPRFDRGIR